MDFTTVQQYCIFKSKMQKLTATKSILPNTCRIGFHLPFNAMTLLAGFMMAESAEIGLLMGLVGSDMSMMTTCAVSPTFSRTQMYLEYDPIKGCAKFVRNYLIWYLLVWLHGEGVEPNVCWRNPHICKLQLYITNLLNVFFTSDTDVGTRALKYG